MIFSRKKNAHESLRHLLVDPAEIELLEPVGEKIFTQRKTTLADSISTVMGEKGMYRETCVFVKLLHLEQKPKRLSRSEENALFSEILLVSEMSMTISLTHSDRMVSRHLSTYSCQSVMGLTFAFDPIPQISRMHHQNLAEFIGLSLTGSNYQVVYERPVKGDVLMLVSTSVIFADMDIRLTLMANIVQVRNFILISRIKMHVILKSGHLLLSLDKTCVFSKIG